MWAPPQANRKIFIKPMRYKFGEFEVNTLAQELLPIEEAQR